MKSSKEKIPLILTPLFFAAILLFFCSITFASGEANLNSSNLVIEQSGDNVSLVLEGPVDITYGTDHLSSDSATAYLGSDLSNLYAAIETVELTGNVKYTGAGGISGSAGQATYNADDRTIVLSGSAQLSKNTFSASASTVEFRIEPEIVTLNGGCRMSQEAISATASNVEYNLRQKTGDFTGSVRVIYKTGGVLFGDEEIDQVELSSDALYVSENDGIVRTPEGPGARRTSVVAGNFTLDADLVTFTGTQAAISSITANGTVIVDGPNLHVEADRISLSTSDRILNVNGNVVFSIMGQDGTADEVELNFASGWSIRLVGANVGGQLDSGLIDSINPGEGDN
jgi:lipopolysaccharide export system protein LptA